jgi:hypothetical protein
MPYYFGREDVPGITYLYAYDDDELMTAARHNRAKAFQLISEGMDPFTMHLHNETTAFHYAADSHPCDLQLLLHMIAKPGTAWTKKFVLSAEAVVDVPVQPRDCIAALSESSTMDFLSDYKGDSMEGWEVMVMFGYRLTPHDLDTVCIPAQARPEDCYPRLKFSLASMMFDATICDDSRPLLDLSWSLETAIGLFPDLVRNIDLARFLLSAGANPNSGHLAQALKNQGIISKIRDFYQPGDFTLWKLQ